MPNFSTLTNFVLIIGSARSGSTLLGSILDAHPNAVVANETASSASFWKELNRQAILNEILANSDDNRKAGRTSSGYSYFIEKGDSGHESTIYVMGDKIWNPAMLLLHGDFGLLDRLEKCLGIPIKIVHSIRNPFDVIATMHARSGAPIWDRAIWYFMHCDASVAIRNRFDEARYLNNYHEGLIERPDESITSLCSFLGLSPQVEYLERCKKLVHHALKKTRYNIMWESEVKREILKKMTQYDFLGRYVVEDYMDLPTE